MYFLTLEGLDYVLQSVQCTVIESSLNVDGVDTLHTVINFQMEYRGNRGKEKKSFKDYFKTQF